MYQTLANPSASRLNSSTELTLFLPVDAAFEGLNPVERLYLESEFAAADLTRILNAHAVAHKSVKWSDTFEPSAKCGFTLMFGNNV